MKNALRSAGGGLGGNGGRLGEGGTGDRGIGGSAYLVTDYLNDFY